MKKRTYPKREIWQDLIKRPDFGNETIEAIVAKILQEVKSRGDEALRDFSKRFDNLSEELSFEANAHVDNGINPHLQKAIDLAMANIEKFHSNQVEVPEKMETSKGITCWRKSLPIEKVGLYVPGGTAPLLSSFMMLGIPAKIAGCEEIVVCTPPGESGEVHPAILYIAKKLGVESVYRIGGAQAIAAMAYGTDSIQKVDKIFGPGNRYVTLAKQKVMLEGTAIDMPAGPSEVLVIADATSEAAFVAADLLSQAEHGTDSQVVLVLSEQNGKTSDVLQKIESELEKQVENLPRKEIAKRALDNSLTVIFNDDEEAVAFSNFYAPEHLILATINADKLAEKVKSAGSVFIGKWSCESLGDYASGTNHTLPTNGFARNYSGVSVDSFVKKVTFQEVSREGLQNIGRTVEILAEAEGLQAHKNAVSIRLK